MMWKISVAIGVTCVSVRVVRVSAVVKDSDTRRNLQLSKLDEDDFSGTVVWGRYKTFLEKVPEPPEESSAAPSTTVQTPIPTSSATEKPLTSRESAIKLARSLGGHKECQDGLTKYLRRGYASINQVLRNSLTRGLFEPGDQYESRKKEAEKDSRLAMCGLEIKREEKRDPEVSSSADRDFREGGLVSRSFIATAEMMEGGENDSYIAKKCGDVRKIYEKTDNIVTEDAFMSTTVSTEPFMGSHVLVIRVPPNNLGVRVETPEEANAGDEKEVLFPPGQQLRILKVIPRNKLEKFTNFFENQKVTDFSGNDNVVVTKAADIKDNEKIRNIEENLKTLLSPGEEDGAWPAFRKSGLGKIISDEDDPEERNRVITSEDDYSYVMQTLLQVRKKSLKPRTGDAPEYGARTLILAEMLDKDQESRTTAWERYETFLREVYRNSAVHGKSEV